ncbi:hypothetical protein ACS0TY_023697 [Phlomoides rotata]
MMKNHNKFLRIITTPYRALCRARDFYVNSMINCANMNAGGLQQSSQAPGLPRSFSAASSARSNDDDEDYRELVRAASARSIGSRDNVDYVRKMRAASRSGPRALPPRSISVAMGRIDEENPIYNFGEDSDGKNIIAGVKSELKYPRSKSHAVGKTPF